MGALLMLGGILGLMWGFHLVNSLSMFWLNDSLPMRPRTTEGLYTLFAMPFLHSGLIDLFANSVTFGVVGAFILLGKDGRYRFAVVFMVSWILGGFLLWTIGRNRIYRGADACDSSMFGMIVSLGLYE